MRFGFPFSVTSDNEMCFVSDLASQFYQLIGAKKRRCVSWHPRGNSNAECGVRLSKNILSALMLEYERTGGQDNDWAKRLPYIEMCLNSTPTTSHGLSPIVTYCGTEPNFPAILFDTNTVKSESLPLGVRELRRKILSINQHIYEQTNKRLESLTKRYEEGTVRDEGLAVGDKVLYLNYLSPSNKRALAASYHDEEYVVLKKVGSNYLIKIATDETDKSEKMVHFDQIRPVKDRHTETEDQRTKRLAAENARHAIGLLMADGNSLDL